MSNSSPTSRAHLRSMAVGAALLLAVTSACTDATGDTAATSTTVALAAETTTSTIAPPATTTVVATPADAERLEFFGSTLGARASGTVSADQTVTYLLEVTEGFLVTGLIESPQDAARFDILGVDGSFLVSDATTGHTLIETGGDIEIVVSGDAAYDLAVAMSPAEIVRFDPGTTGATVNGGAVSGTRQAYVLGAAAGQTMTLSVTSDGDNAAMSLLAPSGDILEAGVTSLTTELPESGNYIVLVGGSPGGTSFQLDITIVA